MCYVTERISTLLIKPVSVSGPHFRSAWNRKFIV